MGERGGEEFTAANCRGGVRWPSRRAMLAWFAIVAVGTSALLVPFTFGPPHVFDEGFVASGGMLIRRGLLPIRDFYVIYGPGQYYFTAAIFTLFGEDLFYTRVAHQIVLACLGGAVVVSAGVVAARSWFAMGLVACAYMTMARVVKPISGYAALPSVLMLVLACLAFARWAQAGQRGWLLTSSLLVGVAGVLRWDFGVFGIVSMCLAMPLVLRSRPMPHQLRTLTLGAAPAAALIVVAFAPFVVLGGAARWWDEVPRFLLLEFKTWRNVDFVAPAWGDARQALAQADARALGQALLKLAFAALPLTAGMAAVLIAGRRLWRARDRFVDPADAAALMLGFVAILLFNQMRVRTGWHQGFPAFVAALPLAAYVLAQWRVFCGAGRGMVVEFRGAVVFAFMAVPVYVFQADLRTRPFEAKPADQLPRATGMRIDDSPQERQNWGDYVGLIRYLQQTTAPGEPIFSGVADTSRLFMNDAMLYFLVDRPAAARWVEMEPGLTNTERGQRELIDALEGRKVHTAVLWNKLSDEPNATARSNKVHVLDDYLRENFVSAREFGAYVVVTRRLR